VFVNGDVTFVLVYSL